jgi:hypothetical protein
MNIKYTLFLVLVSLLFSCKKDTNVVVTNITTGKLSYKLVDNSGKGLPGVKVSLSENLSKNSISYVPIESIMTNPDGVAEFSEHAAGNYLISSDTAVADQVKYLPRENVQFVAGVHKQKETKVTDFSGTITVTVRSRVDYETLLPNIMLVAVPNPIYNDAPSVPALVESAKFKSVTNASGVATLKIPSKIPYYIILYTIGAGIYSAENEVISLSKDENRSYNLYTYRNNQGT